MLLKNVEYFLILSNEKTSLVPMQDILMDFVYYQVRNI